MLTQTLLHSAIASKNWAVVPSLLHQSIEYTKTGYSAGRVRADGIAMNLLNKDAADMYLKNFKMSLGSTNIDRKPAEFIQNINKQTQLAAARAIANKIASDGRSTDRIFDSDGTSGNPKLYGKA